MPLSPEIRRLDRAWTGGQGWAKRLHWLEIDGIRGWAGQRFELRFPIMAVVGENGVGKSTVLQCAASLYSSQQSGAIAKKYRFASDFFPETPWDQIRDASIRGEIKEGDQLKTPAIRKPTDRWRGNPERPRRHVVYIDLTRIQPVPARVGYTRLAKPTHSEVSAEPFEEDKLSRLSAIMGRPYDLAKMALTDADPNRVVPVVGQHGDSYSGFHQGAGETTIAELLQPDIPTNSLVLIDEVESSLHPRAQRRLIRDLAALARERQLQVVLTTHSPYVLEELPLDARAYILQTASGKRNIVYGVSPEFAMTKMDEVPHPECDVYVEDDRAAQVLTEILAAHRAALVQRVRMIPYGAASVGQALGEMVQNNRFPDPVCVFKDGDQMPSPGCHLLPGDDSPEEVVFAALQARNWAGLADRTGREFSDVADACTQAMTLAARHDWVRSAATKLVLGGDTLWQAMCAEWASHCLSSRNAEPVWQPIEDALAQDPQATQTTTSATTGEATPEPEAEPDSRPAATTEKLF